MPTRRRRSRSASGSGEGDYKMGKAIASGAKKGLEGYLKVTNKAADYISSKLPESKTTRGSKSRGGRRGRGGRRTGE